MSAPMTPEQRKAITVQIGDVQPATDALLGTVAESVANVRNHEHPSWEDLYCMNLTSYMGERMAPVLKRLLNTETENAQLRARVDEVESRPRRFTPLEEAVQGIETAIAPLTGDAKAGADMVLAYLRTLTTPNTTVPSAPVDPHHVTEEQARRIERDRPETDTAHDCNLPLSRRLDCGHCPHEVCQDCDRCPHTCRCGDTPAPRDLRPGAETARRMIADRRTAEDPHDSPLHRTYETSHDLPEVAWVDPCHPCGCPKRFDRHSWGCPTLPEVTPEPSRGQCGHDDYHDGHPWADRPHVWCPGHSYADDTEATS